MRWIGLFSLLLITVTATAQENSPYSRYGIGDLVPNQNVINRAMGGISAGFSDYQSINSINPATYSNFSIYSKFPYIKPLNTIFELGAEADIRVLKSSNPAKKFSNTNALFSYLQIGFPIASKKLEKKGINWGMIIGFKPVSRINYNIEKRQRMAIDSLYTQYEGTGGTQQFFFGTGVRVKNFSFGINAGYMFGNKNYNTRLIFINDTVDYYKSNSATKTSFGGLFFNAGVQYFIPLKNNGGLRLGAYGNIKQKLNATQDIIRETYVFDANSNDRYRIDSVYEKLDVKGSLTYPSTFGAGFTWVQGGTSNWMIGADFETTRWSEYRFYNQADYLQNSWTVKVGAQYLPAKQNTSSKKYFNFVKYRAGFNYSAGNLNIGTRLPEYSATVGAGFPLTGRRFINEYVILNTALEMGSRGNQKNLVRENITRFSIGLSMNARWFEKRKYD